MDTFIEFYTKDGGCLHCGIENKDTLDRILISPSGIAEITSVSGSVIVIKENMIYGYFISTPEQRKQRNQHNYKLEQQEEEDKREMRIYEN